MTTQRKQWSTAWIVSTHAMTAGLATPWLGSLSGFAISLYLGLEPTRSFLAILAAEALGYMVGTLLSLFCIRAVAVHPDSKKCIVPAIAAFGVLAAIAMGAHLAFLLQNRSFYGPQLVLLLAGTPIYYFIITAIFAAVTKRGFRALPTSGAEKPRDHRIGLTVFGVFQIVLGAICAAMILILAIRLTLEAARGAAVGRRAAVLAALPFLEAAAILVWLGIGSIRARRWARALTVVLSWLWLLAGVRLVMMLVFLLGPTLLALGPQGAKSRPPIVITKHTIVIGAINGCIYFLLPAVFLLFYQRASVRAACQGRNPQTCWTDRCPLPVLALSVVHVYYVISMPPAALNRCVVPFFGVLISDIPGAAVLLLTALLLACLVWGVYRLKMAAWWGTLLLWSLWAVSNAATFWRVDPMEMYVKMGLSAAQLEIMRKTGVAERMASWSFWVVPLTMIAALGYLFYVRRYFVSGRAR